MRKYSSYVEFETYKSVSLKKIEKGNMKFSRCQKALYENTKEGFFKADL